MKLTGTCRTHGEIRNAYQIVVETSEEKNCLGNLGKDPRIMLKQFLLNWCGLNLSFSEPR
jgi:hypothetical protein